MKNGYFANKMNEIINIERQIKGKGKTIEDNIDTMSKARLEKICYSVCKLCDKAIEKLQDLNAQNPDKLQAKCIETEGKFILNLQTNNYIVLRDLTKKKN